VKRTELIRTITALGAVLERHGAKHDWYVKKETNTGQAIPRHNGLVQEPGWFSHKSPKSREFLNEIHGFCHF
jgi:hypothetical protein